MPSTQPVTISDAAARHGIPKRTILAAVNRGDIRSRKLGGATGAYLLNAGDVEQFVSAWRDRAGRRERSAEATTAS